MICFFKIEQLEYVFIKYDFSRDIILFDDDDWDFFEISFPYITLSWKVNVRVFTLNNVHMRGWNEPLPIAVDLQAIMSK